MRHGLALLVVGEALAVRKVAEITSNRYGLRRPPFARIAVGFLVGETSSHNIGAFAFRQRAPSSRLFILAKKADICLCAGLFLFASDVFLRSVFLFILIIVGFCTRRD